MSGRAHIAVVGGGITGLVAARSLIRSSNSNSNSNSFGPRVTLLEASDRLGGKIQSVPFAGTTVDVGPEALFTQLPAAIELCGELGLGDELVAPAQSKTTVWTRGRLRELAPGILGGLPDGVVPIARSGILSPRGAARAGVDLVLPNGNGKHEDESVGALIRRRLGNEAADRMIDPLLGGIYGGDPDTLSLRATAPRLNVLAQDNRSLIRGLMAAGRRAAPSTSAPMFKTLPGGLERITSGLASEMAEAELCCGERVHALTPLPDGGYQLRTTSDRVLEVDGVILAIPAHCAAELLSESAPAAATELAGIDYNPITVMWLAFAPTALPPLPPGSGFLVPRVDKRMISACTWASAKWRHLAIPDQMLLRCSVGRGRPEATELDDDALVSGALADLREAIGVRADPTESLVVRFDRAMPQYAVGHLERVARLKAAITELPRVKLAGAAYGGIGIPQCITQGEEAAARLASELW